MNTNAAATPRTHRLTIQVAHQLAENERGIVVPSPITLHPDDTRALGLTPILIYSVHDIDRDLGFETLCSWNHPISIPHFLLHAWTQGIQLRGCPDVLEVDSNLAEHVPGLRELASACGIAVAVKTCGHEDMRRHCYLRQFYAFSQATRLMKFDPQRKWKTSNVRVSAINEERLKLHLIGATYLTHPPHAEDHQYRGQFREVPAALFLAAQTAPKQIGTWVIDFDPPARHNRRVWVADDEIHHEDELPYEDAHNLEQLEAAVQGWPGSLERVAQEIGVAAGDLRRHLTRDRPIPERARRLLLALLGLDYHWDPLSGPYLKVVGSNIFVATEETSATVLYSLLTDGNDPTLCKGVIPDDGPEDPSWRFLLIGSQPYSLYLFPRDSEMVQAMDKGNWYESDLGPIKMPSSMYEELRAIGNQALQQPTLAAAALERFSRRHAQWLADQATGWLAPPRGAPDAD